MDQNRLTQENLTALLIAPEHAIVVAEILNLIPIEVAFEEKYSAFIQKNVQSLTLLKEMLMLLKSSKLMTVNHFGLLADQFEIGLQFEHASLNKENEICLNKSPPFAILRLLNKEGLMEERIFQAIMNHFQGGYFLYSTMLKMREGKLLSDENKTILLNALPNLAPDLGSLVAELFYRKLLTDQIFKKILSQGYEKLYANLFDDLVNFNLIVKENVELLFLNSEAVVATILVKCVRYLAVANCLSDDARELLKNLTEEQVLHLQKIVIKLGKKNSTLLTLQLTMHFLKLPLDNPIRKAFIFIMEKVDANSIALIIDNMNCNKNLTDVNHQFAHTIASLASSIPLFFTIPKSLGKIFSDLGIHTEDLLKRYQYKFSNIIGLTDAAKNLLSELTIRTALYLDFVLTNNPEPTSFEHTIQLFHSLDENGITDYIRQKLNETPTKGVGFFDNQQKNQGSFEVPQEPRPK